MKLSKWQIYFLGLAVLFFSFVLPRLFWLKNSVTTTAFVLAIHKTIGPRTRQTYPLFEYYINNNRVTCAGHYNLPYKEGDSVIIRYNPSNVFDIKVDNFMGRWIDKIIWLAPILFVWTVIFIPKDFKPAINLSNGKFKITI